MYSRFYTWQPVQTVSDKTESLTVNQFRINEECIDIRFGLKGYGWKSDQSLSNEIVYQFGSYRCYYRKVGDSDWTLFARPVSERAATEDSRVYKDIHVSTGLIDAALYEVKIEADRLEEFGTWTGAVEGINENGQFWFDLQARELRPNEVDLFDLIGVSEDVNIGLNPIPLSIAESVITLQENFAFEIPGLPLNAFELIFQTEFISMEIFNFVELFETISVVEFFALFFQQLGVFGSDNVSISENVLLGRNPNPLEVFETISVTEFFNGNDDVKIVTGFDAITIVEFVSLTIIDAFRLVSVFDTISIAEFRNIATPHYGIFVFEDLTTTVLESIAASFFVLYHDAEFFSSEYNLWTKTSSGTGSFSRVSGSFGSSFRFFISAFSGSGQVRGQRDVPDLDTQTSEMIFRLQLYHVWSRLSGNTFKIKAVSNKKPAVITLGHDGFVIGDIAPKIRDYPGTFWTTGDISDSTYFDLKLRFVNGSPHVPNNDDGMVEVYVNDVLVGVGPTRAFDDQVWDIIAESTETSGGPYPDMEIRLERVTYRSFSPIASFDIFEADHVVNITEFASVFVPFFAITPFDLVSTTDIAQGYMQGGNLRPIENIGVVDFLVNLDVFPPFHLRGMFDEIFKTEFLVPLLNASQFFSDCSSLTGWSETETGGTSITTDGSNFVLDLGAAAPTNMPILSRNWETDGVVLGKKFSVTMRVKFEKVVGFANKWKVSGRTTPTGGAIIRGFDFAFGLNSSGVFGIEQTANHSYSIPGTIFSRSTVFIPPITLPANFDPTQFFDFRFDIIGYEDTEYTGAYNAPIYFYINGEFVGAGITEPINTQRHFTITGNFLGSGKGKLYIDFIDAMNIMIDQRIYLCACEKPNSFTDITNPFLDEDFPNLTNLSLDEFVYLNTGADIPRSVFDNSSSAEFIRVLFERDIYVDDDLVLATEFVNKLTYIAILVNDDCSSLAGWSETNSGGGDTTIDPAGQFRMDCPSPTSFASLNKTSFNVGGSGLNSIEYIFDMTIDSIGVADDMFVNPNNLRFELASPNGAYTEVRIGSDGVHIRGSDPFTARDRMWTYSVPIGTPFELKIVIESGGRPNSQGGAAPFILGITYVYIDGILVGTGYASGTASPGLCRWTLSGSTIHTEVHFDSILVRSFSEFHSTNINPHTQFRFDQILSTTDVLTGILMQGGNPSVFDAISILENRTVAIV